MSRTQVAGRIAAAALALGGVQSAAARERSPADDLRLDWQVPQGCPERDTVLAQIGVLVEQDEVSRDRFERIGATIERRGASWSLLLEFVSQGSRRTRSMQGASCDELSEAAAVAITLALRSGPADTAN